MRVLTLKCIYMCSHHVQKGLSFCNLEGILQFYFQGLLVSSCKGKIEENVTDSKVTTVKYVFLKDYRILYTGKLRGFCTFSLDHESFPANYGLVDQQYMSTELLQQKFYYE